MGNDNKGKPYQKLTQTCHHGFYIFSYDKQQQLMVTSIKVEESLLTWRKLIDPLFQKKHLLMPYKILAQDKGEEQLCCAQQDFNRPDIQLKRIYYQPFIYSFDKEILSRKHKNANFRQQQIWKLINYLSRAIYQWKSVYPQQKLGVICPQNIIMNTGGQIKVVTKLSFFHNQFINSSDHYTPPQSRTNSVIKYSLNPHRDPTGIQASLVYSMGVVLLQATTLQLFGDSNLNFDQKKQILMPDQRYSIDLRQLILRMVDENQPSRPKVITLLEKVKYNKTRRL